MRSLRTWFIITPVETRRLEPQVTWREGAQRWRWELPMGDEMITGWADTREEAWEAIVGRQNPVKREIRYRLPRALWGTDATKEGMSREAATRKAQGA